MALRITTLSPGRLAKTSAGTGVERSAMMKSTSAGHGDHARRIERRVAFMQGDLDQLLQARQRPRAVILAARLRHVGEQKLHSGSLPDRRANLPVILSEAKDLSCASCHRGMRCKR